MRKTEFRANILAFILPNALQVPNTNQVEVVMEMNTSATVDYNHLKGKNKAKNN